MKLKFINAEDTNHNAKATVHRSGKLGLSSDAIEFLQLSEGKSIQFAINEEDENDKNLYAVVYETIQEGAFKISKAGEYYYINTKNFFDSLDIDYKKSRVIYDLIKLDYEGQKIIKMIRRDIKRVKKELST